MNEYSLGIDLKLRVGLEIIYDENNYNRRGDVELFLNIALEALAIAYAGHLLSQLPRYVPQLS